MINPQWLELPMSQTNFYGPKNVRAIEVRLYTVLNFFRERRVLMGRNGRKRTIGHERPAKIQIRLRECAG